MAFWGINYILCTQRKQYFVTILKDLTRIYEGRVYLKRTVRLEFPLSPLLFFFLKSNIQTFPSLYREMYRVSWNWYSQEYVLLFVFSKSIITRKRLQHDISLEEAVPLGNVIRSKLEKKLDSSLAGVTDQFQRFKRIMKENKWHFWLGQHEKILIRPTKICPRSNVLPGFCWKGKRYPLNKSLFYG